MKKEYLDFIKILPLFMNCLSSYECHRQWARIAKGTHLGHPTMSLGQQDALLDSSSADAVDSRLAVGSSGGQRCIKCMQLRRVNLVRVSRINTMQYSQHVVTDGLWEPEYKSEDGSD